MNIEKLKYRKVDCADACWSEFDLEAGCFEWAGNLCSCRLGTQWINMTLEEVSSSEAMDECNCATIREFACACSKQFTVDSRTQKCVPVRVHQTYLRCSVAVNKLFDSIISWHVVHTFEFSKNGYADNDLIDGYKMRGHVKYIQRGENQGAKSA